MTPTQTAGVQLALFAFETRICAAERKEGYVLRKLQRGLTTVAEWCERWNLRLSYRRGPVGTHLILKGRNILFVKEVK
jgi:hypothetical protein